MIPQVEETVMTINYLDMLPVAAHNIGVWIQKAWVLSKDKQLVLMGERERAALSQFHP